MQSFECSPLILLFLSPPVTVSILWWLCRALQLQLVSSTFSCSSVFSIPQQGPGTYPSFLFFKSLLCGQSGQKSLQFCKFSFCCWQSYSLLGDPFVSQNPWGVWASQSLGRILGCAYTICLYCQISISCITPSGSPCPPSCYIIYDMDFRFVPSDPVCFDKLSHCD